MKDVYAVKHIDNEVIQNSRSGGIFTALSDWILENNGVVYGCILDENNIARHDRAICKDKRDLMCGSKYVQSKMGDSFKNTREDLQKGNLVLFSGTSCQILGLKQFLQKEYDNLLCVDIACHGVPSPKVWNSYLKWQTKGNIVVKVDFRNKKFGWREHIETIKTDKQEIHSRVWTTIFYGGNALRPCCYECPYKSIEHPGDITIADYWGIENSVPEFDDNRGVSLVIINSNKGSYYFNNIQDAIVCRKTRIEDSMQRAFIQPEKRPSTRDAFWEDYKKKKFVKIAQKYGGYIGAARKIKQKFKRVLKALFE